MATGQLHIIPRTVRRTLPEVTEWLADHAIRLEAKAGFGLRLYGEPAQHQAALAALSHPDEQSIGGAERRREIVRALLSARDPVKSAWLCRRFGISGGTLSRDLDAVEEWARPYGLALSRRAGSGICLSGSEASYRSAVAAAADSRALLDYLHGAAAPLFPALLPREQAGQVEQIIRRTEERLGILLSDSSHADLFVLLSLAVRRLRGQEQVVLPEDRLAKLRLMPQYAAAEAIADDLHRAFSLAIPADEVGFITMHLAGSSVRTRSSCDWTDVNALSLYRLARSMTQVAAGHFL